MIYGSVCSGIEAATVAWHALGWKPAWFSEIEPFPSAVLAHHYPQIPNLGDMAKIHDSEVFRGATIDLLVGGTPCQAFSVAGLRKGLADPRGNLALVFLGLADAARPRWLVWENVPGVLSSNGGRDFGAFLGALAELGYGFAYRVLDAQYFGVAQRRRRVFVVGYLGDWRRAAAVLFERDSLSGNPAPSRETGAGVAALTASGVGTCGADDNQAQAGHLIAHTLRGEGFDASEDGTGRGIPLVAATLTAREGKGPDSDATTTLIAFTSKDHGQDAGEVSPTLRSLNGEHANGGGQVAIAFAENSRAEVRLEGGDGSHVGALKTGGGKPGQSYPVAMVASGVRRLTPRECERLQGFPDDYTLIQHRGKLAADGPRYKAIGNSMAVPVMAWIGQRIAEVEALCRNT